PNPTSSNVTISNTEIGTKIDVFNQMGQLVLSTETNAGNTVIDVRNLENGIYTIKTIDTNKTGVAKFIKE
ncbi:MAG: T9SS type A sorting domain-containing protein, partial [Bacteroidota bacterium]